MVDAATEDASVSHELERQEALQSTVTELVEQAATAAPPKPQAVKRQITDALPGFKSIDGFLTVAEGDLLFSYAKAVTEGCIVEVGSYRGRSTAALCAGVSAGPTASGEHTVPVYAVEPHEKFVGVRGAKFGPGDRREFFKNMVEHRMVRFVRLLNATSRVVSPGWHTPVSLLYLDGDHRYESTLADFEAWRPHLVDGAVVMFADALDEGPGRVISEFAARKMLNKVEAVGKVTVF